MKRLQHDNHTCNIEFRYIKWYDANIEDVLFYCSTTDVLFGEDVLGGFLGEVVDVLDEEAGEGGEGVEFCEEVVSFLRVFYGVC